MEAEAEFKRVIDYIDRSHEVVQRAEQRERFRNRVLIGLTGACVMLAGVSLWFGIESNNSRIATEAHPLAPA